MKSNKRGQSTNLVLLVGVILATAISVFAVYTTFDDVVKSMVTGDPEIAARELTSYMDIAASSPNELTIYSSTPTTVAGFPAYGTVLLNAEDQQIRVHPYPQDLMQTQILKSMYGEISAGEVYSVMALYGYRSSDVVLRAQSRLAGSIAQDLGARAAKDQAVRETQEALAQDFFGNLDMLERRAMQDLTYDLAPARAQAYLDLEEKYANKLAKKQSKQIRVARGGSKLSKIRRAAAWIWPPSLARKAVAGTAWVSSKVGLTEFAEKVVRNLEKKAAKRATKKAGEGVARGATATIILDIGENAEDVACAIPTPPSQAVCKASSGIRRGMFMAFMIGEGIWTFFPIYHGISNSRDATEQINNKFGSFEYHTGNIPIHVAVPNCESEPYVVNMELDAGGVLDIIGIQDILSSQMNMPMSESTDKIKTYRGITNKQEDCFDAHNWYMTDGGLITDILMLEKYVVTHPYTVGIAAPVITCGAIGMTKEPSSGSSCIMMMEASLLGAWSNQENSVLTISGWKENLKGNAFMATILLIMTKPEPNFFESKAGAAALGLYNLMPLDSVNLFSYISGADELIDGDKEYYMEDPNVIAISKEYDEDADEYVLVVDKTI